MKKIVKFIYGQNSDRRIQIFIVCVVLSELFMWKFGYEVGIVREGLGFYTNFNRMLVGLCVMPPILYVAFPVSVVLVRAMLIYLYQGARFVLSGHLSVRILKSILRTAYGKNEDVRATIFLVFIVFVQIVFISLGVDFGFSSIEITTTEFLVKSTLSLVSMSAVAYFMMAMIIDVLKTVVAILLADIKVQRMTKRN